MDDRLAAASEERAPVLPPPCPHPDCAEHYPTTAACEQQLLLPLPPQLTAMTAWSGTPPA